MTITLQIDTETAERARRIAEQRQTTLDALVREFLDQLAETSDESRVIQSGHLMQTLHEFSRPMGDKPWQDRDELHER